MAAAALQAAQQFVEAGAPEPRTKRHRGEEAPMQAAGSSEVLLTQLLRSHLLQNNQLIDATNSTQLVVLVQDEEDKKYLLGLVNAWHAKQKEVTLSPEQRRAGQQQKPNEFGPRKVFLFHALLDRMSKVAPPDSKAALTHLLQLEDSVVDLSLSTFGPEYSTPKDGRSWKWKVCMSALAVDSFRQQWVILAQNFVRSGAVPWLVEPSRQFQSQLTKDLWAALKERAPAGPSA